MTEELKQKFSDSQYVAGLLIFGACSLLLLVPSSGTTEGAPWEAPMFIIVFASAIIYFLLLSGSGRLRRGREGLHSLMLLLMTGLVSAFLLNRNMMLFEPSASWFASLLVVCCFNYILFNFFQFFHPLLRHLVLFFAGISLACFIYLAIYLIPAYFISFIALPALGISFHTFLPVLFCIYTVVLVRRTLRQFPSPIPSFWFGLAAAIITVAIYAVSWNNAQAKLEDDYARSSGSLDIPNWLQVARETEPGTIQEKILKSEINFDVAGDMDFLFSSGKSEYLRHDPLVMVASLFSGKLSIPVDERAKIIHSIYGEGHVFEDRLWSGFGLETDSVTTTAELWPAYRLSYTDIVMNVRVNESVWWSNEREAIYSFQLPEGSVVSSLSLWIDGVEQKGLLTSKGKADTAYKTIVGVQRRDPSVVHWMEGNRVSLRVFPVVPGTGRKFRIGITSPLKETAKGISYERVRFTGPDSRPADETASIVVHGDKQVMDQGNNFSTTGNGIYHSKKGYSKDWEISMEAEALATGGFAFNNQNYQLVKTEKKFIPFDPFAIYLDLNNTWTKSEFDQVIAAAGSKPVYTQANDQPLVQVNAGNAESLFESAGKTRFSVFPFYELKNNFNVLVIGKSTPVSPDLGTLKGTPFMEKTASWFSSGQTIRYFSLTDNFSPYLRSLREFRVIQAETGPVTELVSLLSAARFPASQETPDRILLNNSQYAIERSQQQFSSSAPDHLMRLFAYNGILARSGRKLLAKEVDDDNSVTEATTAHIVSPFSSLIVLETQADYDRFNIRESKDSLGNAAVHSTGSVPEPHEWALIIATLLFIFYMRSGRRPVFAQRNR